MAALGATIAVWSFLRPGAEPERSVSRLTVNLPSGQALIHPNDPAVALSPDGKHVVYVAGSSDETKLYVRRLDELDARQIPGTEGAMTAFFSPDGEWVGFYGAGKIEKVRLDGGSSSVLCQAPDPWGASWGPGDAVLFAPVEYSALSLVPARGGSPSVASTLDSSQGEIAHRWPEILPGGRSALFTIVTVDRGFRVGLLSLDTGKHRVLLDKGSFARYVPTGHLLYGSEGIILAVPFDLERLAVAGEPSPMIDDGWTSSINGTAHFALSQDGTLAYVPRESRERSLVWVDRAGLLRPLTKTRRAFQDPRLSPDGQRLAVSIFEDGRLHIWIYEIARDAFVRLSHGAEDDQGPLWTPDGKRLAFTRGLPRNLFWQPSDGSGSAERLSTSPFLQRATSWSPDGKALVYVEWPQSSGTEDIWVLSIEGEPKQRRLLETPFKESYGVVSPDGRFIALASDESGKYEIYVRRFLDAGGKWQISNGGGTGPVWARSGSEIFYRNGDKMMSVAIETEPTFRAGRPSVLFEENFYRPDAVFPQYDVTADDRNFVMIQGVESWPTQIHVVLNWFEELKARVPTRPR